MIKASEFCKRVFDGTHDTPKPVSNGYKLLTSKHIMNNYLDTDSAYCISEEDYNKINKRSQVRKWDVLFSMIGSVGTVYLVTEDKIDFAIKTTCFAFKFFTKILCSLSGYTLKLTIFSATTS